jgi:NAD(P)-dependent dehydrogenase (short-subunit alcohol dehydrogenase family)
VHPLFDLDARVAVVTGGGTGVGRAMAEALADAGASVVLVGRRLNRLEEVAQSIEANKGQAAAVSADLQDRAGLAAVATSVTKPFGSPDILINAAGVNLRESIDKVTRETWDLTLDLNLAVPFFFARELVSSMCAKGWGRVINIASLQSLRAFPDSLPYGAAKGGVPQLTRAMAQAWSPAGVTCNAIAPGFFPTALTAPVFDDPERAAWAAAQTAVGRNGRAEDLHGVTIFLAAPASDYITGQVIFVDGGFTAR